MIPNCGRIITASSSFTPRYLSIYFPLLFAKLNDPFIFFLLLCCCGALSQTMTSFLLSFLYKLYVTPRSRDKIETRSLWPAQDIQTRSFVHTVYAYSRGPAIAGGRSSASTTRKLLE